MPLATIIDVIENLVLGRAEPSTVRPHLLTLRDQAAALEREAKANRSNAKLKKAEAENKILASQNASLEAQNALLTEQSGRFATQLAKALEEIGAIRKTIVFPTQAEPEDAASKQARKRTGRYSQQEENVFRLILTNVPLTTEEIMEALRNASLVDLERDGLIEQRLENRDGRSLMCWFITAEGMSYVERHRLDK